MNNLLKKYYPLADEPSPEELYNLEVSDKVGVRAMATGEMRAPRKGEWFLSGAVVELRIEQTMIFRSNTTLLSWLSCDTSTTL